MTESTPPDDSSKKTTPSRSWKRRVSVILLIILVLLVIGGIGAAPYWTPLLPWAPRADQRDDLADRLDRIEQRLGAIDSLATRLAALERKPAPDAGALVAPLQGQLGDLQARLDRDEAALTRLTKDQTSSGDSAERVLIVSLANLGNAIASSRPFATELASVEALGQTRPGWAASLKPLEEPAKTGIPGTAILAQRFSDTTAAAILRAEASGPTGSMSYGDAIMARLRSLIVVRRVDGPSGSGRPVDAAVATADAALAHGDLAGAVAALDNLSGAPAQAAASWLKDAHQRLQAEDAIAKLAQQVSSDLAAGTSGG